MSSKPRSRPRLTEAEIDRRLLAAYRALGVFDEDEQERTEDEETKSDQLVG